MKHATSRILFAYWDLLRGERAAPERGDVEPGAIREVIADTFILGLEPGSRATFRLAGTRCSAMFGRDLKGVVLSDLWTAGDRHEVDAAVDAVVSDANGIVLGATASSELGHGLALELVLLPLRHRGRTHARVLGCLSPLAMPSWIGLAPLSGLETRSLRTLHPARAAVPVPAPAKPVDAALTRRGKFVVYEGGRSASPP